MEAMIIILIVFAIFAFIAAYWFGYNFGKHEGRKEGYNDGRRMLDSGPSEHCNCRTVVPDIKISVDGNMSSKDIPSKCTWVMDCPKSEIDQRIEILNTNLVTSINYNPPGSFYCKGKAKNDSWCDLNGIYFYDPTRKEG